MCVQVSADYVVPHLTLKTVVGLTQNPRVRYLSPQHHAAIPRAEALSICNVSMMPCRMACQCNTMHVPERGVTGLTSMV